MGYQNDFLGCDLGSVIWITSDKAMMNLIQAVSDRKAACVSSQQASGGRSDVIDVSEQKLFILRFFFSLFVLNTLSDLKCKENLNQSYKY